MRSTAMILLVLVGGLFPAFATNASAAPLTSVERDILADFTDADIENLRRVMDNDLWRSIVNNWHLKSPAQKALLQQRLQEYAAQPNPQEWANQNRQGWSALLQGGGGGLVAGALATTVPLMTTLVRNLNNAHVVAAGGTAPLSRFFTTFFTPTLIEKTANVTRTAIKANWGRIGIFAAVGALVGGAALYGITKLVQNYRHSKAERAYGTERDRLHRQLSEIAAQTSPQTTQPGDQQPAGTVGPGSVPVVAPAAPGGAPGIDGDDVRVADHP